MRVQLTNCFQMNLLYLDTKTDNLWILKLCCNEDACHFCDSVASAKVCYLASIHAAEMAVAYCTIRK